MGKALSGLQPDVTAVRHGWLQDYGIPDEQHAWNATLLRLEAMATGQGAGLTLSLDGDRHSWRRVFSLLLSRLGLRAIKPLNYAAPLLVPALLTFIDRPLRIVIVGRSGDGLDSVASRLASHAPWHRCTPAAIDRLGNRPHFDLAVIAIPDMGAEDLLRLALLPANLKLICDTLPEQLVTRIGPVETSSRNTKFDPQRQAA